MRAARFRDASLDTVEPAALRTLVAEAPERRELLAQVAETWDVSEPDIVQHVFDPFVVPRGRGPPIQATEARGRAFGLYATAVVLVRAKPLARAWGKRLMHELTVAHGQRFDFRVQPDLAHPVYLSADPVTGDLVTTATRPPPRRSLLYPVLAIFVDLAASAREAPPDKEGAEGLAWKDLCARATTVWRLTDLAAAGVVRAEA